jgi:sugar phosphate permease
MTIVIFGALGVIWAAVWFYYYRDVPGEHRSVNQAEAELINKSVGARSRTTANVPWKRILANRDVWTLTVMYFCYSFCFSMYLTWFPTYLYEHRKFNLTEMGLYASLPMLTGVVGNLLGGWISDRWASRTGNLKLARRTVAIVGFLIAGTCIVPATFTSDPIESVIYTCCALFGLELTVGVSWAIPLDIGGDYAGSVSAVMNSFGNIGGTISPTLLGYLVSTSGWNTPFVVAAVMCMIAAALYLKIDSTKHLLAGE